MQEGEGVPRLVLESANDRAGEFHRIQRVVLCKRGEVHAEDHLGGRVSGVRLVEGGVGGAASHDGEIVAFAAGDLGFEAGVQVSRQDIAAAYVHADFFGVGHPIERAPDLATDDRPGTLGPRQGANGSNH